MTSLIERPISLDGSRRATPNSSLSPENTFCGSAVAESAWRLYTTAAVSQIMAIETLRTFIEIEQAKQREISREPEVRAILSAEKYEKKHGSGLITNGFLPYPELVLRAMEKKILEPISDYLEPVAPILELMRQGNDITLRNAREAINMSANELLLNHPKRWLENLGYRVDYGTHKNNALTTDGFFELVDNIKNMAGKGQLEFLIGVSAGGVMNEMAARYLEKTEGRSFVKKLIRVVSPEVSQKSLDRFTSNSNSSTLIEEMHQIAGVQMAQDPKRGKNPEYSEFQELMMEHIADSFYKPHHKMFVIANKDDNVVPFPLIEPDFTIERDMYHNGVTHASTISDIRVIDFLGTHVLSRPIIPSQKSRHFHFDDPDNKMLKAA